MFMEYRWPERVGIDMGPHRSTYTRSRGVVALAPSLTFGMDECVCLPRMQCSHLEGGEEVLMVIPSMALEHAMLRMVCGPQWPRRQCQVVMSGKREV